MIIRSTSPLFGGWEGQAVLSTEPPFSRYGQPVLMVEGYPIDQQDAVIAGYKLIDADDNERACLARSRYDLLG